MGINPVKGRGAAILLATSAGYWIVAAIAPTFYVIQSIGVILMLVCVGVVVAYRRLIWGSLTAPTLDRSRQLTIGIVLAWGALGFALAWSELAQVLDAKWMSTSPIAGYYLYLYIVAAIFHITAPGADRSAWWAIAIAAVVVTAAAAFLYFTHLGFPLAIASAKQA